MGDFNPNPNNQIVRRRNPFVNAGYALAQRVAPAFARRFGQRLEMVRNRFYRGGFGGTLGRYNARSAAQRASRGRSFTMTRRKRGSGGQGVTSQYDRSLIYRKRSMPRGRRRRWRRYVKRVNFVSEKALGTRTVVRNSLLTVQQTFATGNDQVQQVPVLSLYGMRNTALDFDNDLSVICGDTDLGTTGKLLFQSGVFDMTVRNTSFTTSIGTGNTAATLEIDVYEMTAGRQFALPGEATNMGAALALGNTDTATIPGLATALTPQSRGWTPWDTPAALSQYRMKIWKKTKFFLSSNQTFTYQYRDPRRHVFDKQSMPTTTCDNMPGMTRFFVIVMKPTPGYTYSTEGGVDYAQIQIGITRKYMYKIAESTQDYEAFNT